MQVQVLRSQPLHPSKPTGQDGWQEAMGPLRQRQHAEDSHRVWQAVPDLRGCVEDERSA